MVVLLLAAGRAQSGGSGSIAGRVVDSTTGAPLHRARVEIHVEGRNDMRGMAPSDGDGRFLLRALPAGQYRIEVSRRGYGTMAYGARRPFAEGRALALGAGEQITDLTIGLPRLGVIAGTVTGADGEPLAQANIQALRRQFTRGKLSWDARGVAQTDDKGRFRLFGVRRIRAIQRSRTTAWRTPRPTLRARRCATRRGRSSWGRDRRWRAWRSPCC
jgi:hypothetical protein